MNHNKINKGELVTKVAKKTQKTKKEVEQMLNSFLDEIRDSLVRDEKVVITGFGTFKNSHRDQRVGRNPKDGTEVLIPAMTIPSFTAGKSDRKSVV